MKERLIWMDKRLGYTYVPNGIEEVSVDLEEPYEVYSLSGQFCGHSLDALRPGTYIIRQASKSRKVVIK